MIASNMVALRIINAKTGAVTAYSVRDKTMSLVRVSLPAGWHQAGEELPRLVVYTDTGRAEAALDTVAAIKVIHRLTAARLAVMIGSSTRSIENWSQRVAMPSTAAQTLIFKIAGELFPVERSGK